MKLRKLLDLVGILIDLKPQITLYSKDGAFCIEVSKDYSCSYYDDLCYTVYSDPESPILEEVKDLFDDVYRAELEENGIDMDSDWRMDEDDAKELETLVNNTSKAFEELMEEKDA